MANQPWLDEVRQRLAKHALPPSYIQRFVGELSDHLEDLKEENMSTQAAMCSRLGEPSQVAEAAVVAFQRRSFLDRHPAATFLVFGISPLASLIALFALVLVGLWAFDRVTERLGFNIDHLLMEMNQFKPAASVALPCVMSLLTVVIPCILASILYCKLAKRWGIGKKWMLLSCTVLALMAVTPFWSVELSGIPGQSALRCALAIPQSVGQLPHTVLWLFCHLSNLVQFIVPLAIGCWFMRPKRDNGQAQLAS